MANKKGLTLKDVPGQEERVQQEAEEVARRFQTEELVSGLKFKTFSQLSPSEKDLLLKCIALKFSIIKPDS